MKMSTILEEPEMENLPDTYEHSKSTTEDRKSGGSSSKAGR